MKTYRDFDFTLIKKEMLKFGKEKGKSPEELNEMFDEMMEANAFKTLSVKFPCRTCGVKFPINNWEHDCQEENIWLSKYVKNSVLNKAVPTSIISKLKMNYPLKDKEVMVFRGINFETKEQYDLFMEEIKDGKMTYKDVSSWSLNYNQAKKFASVVQKGTRKTNEELRVILEKLVEEKANITGYKGIVLILDVTKRDVLADISKSFINGMEEDEIILMPGQYKVNIAFELDKKVGVKDWDEEFLEIVNEQLAEL